MADNKGFLLLEVVLSVALLATAALLLGGALMGNVKYQVDAEMASTAAFLAQEKAEELKSVSWDQLVTEAESAVPHYEKYRRSVTVTPLNSFTKQVTIRVRYSLHGGKAAEQIIVFERTNNF